MTEETFIRELERRAEREYGGVHGAPLTFEDVRGQAHRIRRRRRAAAAGAVAALVAVAIVVPTALTGGSDRSQGPDPAPPSPTVPGASVLHDGVVTRPDGSTVPVDVSNENVTEFGVLTDGRIVMALQEPYAVRVYAADGSVESQHAVQANLITMSADDSVVAWVDENFQVALLRSGAERPTTLPGIPMPGEAAGSIDAVLDDEHVLVGDHSTTTGELTSAGLTDLTTSEPLRVTDVSPDGDLWAVQYPDDSDPQYGCAGLYDPDAGRMTARSCDANGLRFSPDGRHLLSRFAENVGQSSELTVLDLGLQSELVYAPAGRSIKEAAWGDADHVLATVAGLEDAPQWVVARVPLDGGRAEVVAGPVAGPNPEFPSEFILSE